MHLFKTKPKNKSLPFVCISLLYIELWHVCFDRSTTAFRFDYMRQTGEIVSSEASQGRHSGPYLLSVKHTRAVEGVTNLRRHIISWSASNNNSYGEQSCSDLCDCGSRCRYESYTKLFYLHLSRQQIPMLFKYSGLRLLLNSLTVQFPLSRIELGLNDFCFDKFSCESSSPPCNTNKIFFAVL